LSPKCNRKTQGRSGVSERRFRECRGRVQGRSLIVLIRISFKKKKGGRDTFRSEMDGRGDGVPGRGRRRPKDTLF